MYIDRSYIINEFKRVSKKLGKKSIPRRDFLSNSNISEWHIMKLFGSYNEAVIAAGLKPIPKMKRPTDEEIFNEMLRVFSETDGICTAFEFGRRSKYGRGLPARIFGSWKKAVYSFAEWVRSTGENFSWLPELAKPREDFNETSKDKREIDKKVIKKLVYESKGGVRYGSFISFRGLLHAPINEQGVVFLFGMICFELGFIVEAIRPQYPDCEAKRRIDKRRDIWEKVKIEFEYQSSNFRDHSHNPEECDLIVCWEHNWEDCPIEVLELKSAIANLET